MWRRRPPPRPTVSVVIACYNHAPYVQDCLRSVLEQNGPDLEVCITDDGSTDDSVHRINNIQDPRIHLQAFDANQGACAAMNDAIRRSRGRYLAVLNSDDVFMPDKLARQVALLESRPEVGAVFGWPRFIDEQGQLFDDPAHKDHRVFHVQCADRFAWLRHFFDHGNALCHPTAMVRRSVYEQVGLYDQRLAQVPDLDMWIRVCAHAEILVEPIPSTGFRIRDGFQNASAARPEVVVRDAWERAYVLRHYLGFPLADLARIFADFDPTQSSAAGFMAHRALLIGHPFYQRFALDALFHDLPPCDGPLQPPSHRAGWLQAKSSMAPPPGRWREFHQLTGQHDVHRLHLKR